jgi:hypothetical protein
MKTRTIAIATAFALSSSFALAQTGGATGAGATLPQTSGPVVKGNVKSNSGVVGRGSTAGSETTGFNQSTSRPGPGSMGTDNSATGMAITPGQSPVGRENGR